MSCPSMLSWLSPILIIIVVGTSVSTTIVTLKATQSESTVVGRRQDASFQLRVDAALINYRLHGSNAIAVNDCINAAMAKLRKETCVELRPIAVADSFDDDAIMFQEAPHCQWRERNKTALVGPNCLSEEGCLRLVAQAITNERPHHGAARHLNVKFNCSDRCTRICYSGGETTPDCQCKCGLGFSGPHCENLAFKDQFSDPSCGTINTDDTEGTISLSSYPNVAARGTFCQWHIRAKQPWDTIEFEWLELDLNSEDALPGSKCADTLVVAGVKGLEAPVPCNHEMRSFVSRRWRSSGDWVLITYSAANWVPGRHKGPLIKYKISTQSSKEIRSFNDAFTSDAPRPAHLLGVCLVLLSLLLV